MPFNGRGTTAWDPAWSCAGRRIWGRCNGRTGRSPRAVSSSAPCTRCRAGPGGRWKMGRDVRAASSWGALSPRVEKLVNRSSGAGTAGRNFFRFPIASGKNRVIVQKNPRSWFFHPHTERRTPYERPGWFRRDDFAIKCPNGFLHCPGSGDGGRGESVGTLYCR